MKKYHAALLPVIGLMLPCAAEADVVSLNPFIQDGSFENPATICCASPTGWFQGGTTIGYAGNFDPLQWQGYPGTTNLVALTGNEVAYVNNYNQVNNSMSDYEYLAQTLSGVSMVTGWTY